MDKEFELGKAQYLSVIEFIKLQHEGQFRAFSMAPYWTHPIRVAALVMRYKKSHKIDELIISALLHDVVEDTSVSLSMIKDKYGDLVSSLVSELTSDSLKQKEMGKTLYLCDKMAHMSDWGLVIKLCDRLDNVTDFAFAPTKFVNKYAKETLDVLSYIECKRTLSQTHISIIKDIQAMVAIYWQEPLLNYAPMPVCIPVDKEVI